ncbi:MAG: single-stranded DNA-binding protein [Bacteroidales bacterium]|nr:single-stranded DNA-binding protein [Candidatus Cryptobacteroides caccocaballi]
MSLNKAMLIGNVGKDPEVRYLEQNSPNSAKVASFTLATTERFRDRNGETRENTEWHNVVAWRSNADVVEKFVKKGTQLYVEGRIRSRSWDGQDGTKHYITEIVADTIQLLGNRRDNPGADAAASQPSYAPQPQVSTAPQPQPYSPIAQPAPAAKPAVVSEGPDDDLPF